MKSFLSLFFCWCTVNAALAETTFHFEDHFSYGHLSPYEQCLISLPIEHVTEARESIRGQPACTNASHSVNGRDIPDHCDLSRFTWRDRTKGISVFIGAPYTYPGEDAARRGHHFNERAGFRKTWDLPVPQSAFGHSGDLVQSLTARGISAFHFVGDSLMVQLKSFLNCDLVRSGSSAESAPVSHQSYSAGPVHFDYFGSFKWQDLRFSNYDGFDLVLNESLASFAASPAPQVLFFEAGAVRLKPGAAPSSSKRRPSTLDEDPPTAMRNVAQALLTWAHAHPHVTVVLRETSAQHFARVGGSYEGTALSVVKTPFTCDRVPAKEEQIGNRANPPLLEALAELDADWRSHIGYVAFFNHSLALYDLHKEGLSPHYSHGADCTHWIYVPNFMDVVWYSVRMEVERLRSNNAKKRG